MWTAGATLESQAIDARSVMRSRDTATATSRANVAFENAFFTRSQRQSGDLVVVAARTGCRPSIWRNFRPADPAISTDGRAAVGSPQRSTWVNSLALERVKKRCSFHLRDSNFMRRFFRDHDVAGSTIYVPPVARATLDQQHFNQGAPAASAIVRLRNDTVAYASMTSRCDATIRRRRCVRHRRISHFQAHVHCDGIDAFPNENDVLYNDPVGADYGNARYWTRRSATARLARTRLTFEWFGCDAGDVVTFYIPGST